MKKLLLFPVLALFSIVSFAQDKTMMVGLNGGITGAACVNCSAFAGGGGLFQYAATEKIAGEVAVNYYPDKDVIFGTTYRTTVFTAGVAGYFYPKEAFKGFFIGPDITYISLGTSTEFGGNKTTTSDGKITFGLTLGGAVNIADIMSLVPYIGYGTWYENSKGRLTFGTKLAFKFGG